MVVAGMLLGEKTPAVRVRMEWRDGRWALEPDEEGRGVGGRLRIGRRDRVPAATRSSNERLRKLDPPHAPLQP